MSRATRVHAARANLDELEALRHRHRREHRRERLDTLEPAEQAQFEEIQQLEAEREQLRGQLRALAARETQLRAGAEDRTSVLQQESQALEELLEETLLDVSQKESEITEDEFQEILAFAERNGYANTRGRRGTVRSR